MLYDFLNGTKKKIKRYSKCLKLNTLYHTFMTEFCLFFIVCLSHNTLCGMINCVKPDQNDPEEAV